MGGSVVNAKLKLQVPLQRGQKLDHGKDAESPHSAVALGTSDGYGGEMTQAPMDRGGQDREAETSRVRALRELGAVDGPPNAKFDRVVRMAALVFNAPRAAVVLVDRDRVHLKAAVGVTLGDRPRAGTLAGVMVRRAETIICGDIQADPSIGPMLPELHLVDVRFFACSPLITPGGEVIGLLSVGDPAPHDPPTDAQCQALKDLADQAMEQLLQDAALARSSRRLDLAFEAGGLAEFEWEIAADRLLISSRASALTGLPVGAHDHALRRVIGGPVAAADGRSFVRAARDALFGRADMDVEVRWVRPDTGRAVWLSVRGVRLDDGDPPLRKLVGVLQDITRRKEEDQRREALAAELDHRVKNMLATVQTVANQSARKTTSIEAFLKAFNGRLRAMASAHELLTATRWRGAHLRDVVAAELGGMEPGQTLVRGPDLYLAPRSAAAVALALHELTASALRDGALSVEGGRVEVVWQRRAGGGFVLDWIETGGPAAASAASDSFSATVLGEVTARELEGRVIVQHASGGVRARLEAAPSALAAPAAEPLGGASPSVEAATPQMIDSDPGDIQGLRVLIVEDSVLLALELEQGLTDLGAVVVGNAAGVSQAMQLLDADFDVAVLDANLNGEPVLQVARALQEMGRPFIFATGYADSAAPSGFDAPIVRKPYNIGQIARALAQVHAGLNAADPSLVAV
jgi:two-component sensor histidine kinase